MKLKYSQAHHRTRDDFVKFDDLPLIYRNWRELKVNYAPWMDIITRNMAQQVLAMKFLTFMATITMNEETSTRLKAGEILFIDNGRFLHSRKSITPDSQRCLKRLWIKT